MKKEKNIIIEKTLPLFPYTPIPLYPYPFKFKNK